MPVAHGPLLRPNLSVSLGEDPMQVILEDPYRLGGPLTMSRPTFEIIRLFDGTRTITQASKDSSAICGGHPVAKETIQRLADRLDVEYFLVSPRLHERLNSPDRPPSCIGSYHADPQKLRQQLKQLFTADGGPGVVGKAGSRVDEEGPVRAVLLPHMDYARGNVAYGWGFKELVERTDRKSVV